MKTVCFTGHRKISGTPELSQKLRNILEELVQKGVTDFYAGGALGFDQLCEESVIELKRKYSAIKLHIILPCPQSEQTRYWNSEQVYRYNEILKKADDVTILSKRYTPYCMKKRNEKLIENADCCVCYYNEYKSGTGQTVRMAENKGIPVFNLAGKVID